MVKFFRDADSEEAYKMTFAFYNYDMNLEELEQRKFGQLKEYILSVEDYTAFSQSRLILDLNKIMERKVLMEYFFELAGERSINIFVMYSKVKNQSFFNRYQWWWKDYNCLGARLEKFSDEKYFEQVFDNGDVLIWKVKPLAAQTDDEEIRE